MIKIGLTAAFFYPDKSRTVFGPKSLTYAENDMLAWLSQDDCMPFIIPDIKDKQLDNYLDNIDVLVLQGGSDIAPQTYHHEPIANGRWPGDAHRDQYELRVLDRALKKKIPVLGICRGFQLLNVYFGGTLFQDIETEVSNKVAHRDADAYDKISHEIELVDGELLQNIYLGQNEIRVNSVHHQAIKKLGENLVVDALSTPDKIIEAFHYNDMTKHFVIAVQWHPEFSHSLGKQVADPDLLLNYFLSQAEKQK